MRLVCGNVGCPGEITVSLHNPGPAPAPCSLPHVSGYAAPVFDEYKALVAHLVRRRMALGLDQADLNAIMGTAEGYVSKLESFARVATLPMLQLWAQALGQDITTKPAPLPAATAAAIQRRSTSPYRREMNRSKHAERRE